ncbi:cytochrome P450 [Dentipellis sp. KUC8613]|nr:cytochrome P450 [Dentipellis sp. KUC8613]
MIPPQTVVPSDYLIPHLSSAIPLFAGIISCAVLHHFQIRGDHGLTILLTSIFLSSCLASSPFHVPLSVSFSWNVIYLATLFISTIFYRISPWHPLASFPGPFTWRLSTAAIAYVSYTGRRHVILDDLHRRYGRIVRIGPNMLSVNSASATAFYDVSHRMTKSDVYNRPGRARGVTLFFKQGMAEHAKRKKLWANAFTSAAVTHYFSVLDRKSQELVDYIEQRKDASGVLDIVTCISRWSSDYMGEMLFGCCSTMKFMKNGDRQGIMHNGKKLAALLDSLGHIAWLMDIINHLPIPTALFDFGCLAVDAFRARELIDDPKAKDLTSHLLNGDSRTGEHIPSAELSVDMSIAFQAGADSTATLILFLLYFMLSNPSYYQDVRDELDQLFPDSTSTLEMSMLASAPLLNANLNESIRLSTSFFLPRVVAKEGITVTGHYIPAGTIVAMATYSQQIAAENFSPEPLVYRPERWLPGGLGPSYVTNKAIVSPFSSGPFVCVAKRFSLQEIRFVIARLVLTLDMRLPPSFDAEEFLRAVRHTRTTFFNKPLLVAVSRRVRVGDPGPSLRS